MERLGRRLNFHLFQATISKKKDGRRRLDSGDGAKKIEQEKTVSTAPTIRTPG